MIDPAPDQIERVELRVFDGMRWRHFRQSLETESWMACAIVGLVLIPGLVAVVYFVIVFLSWMLK